MVVDSEELEKMDASELLRTPTLIRDRPHRGEEQGILLGESDGVSSNPHKQSSFCDTEDQDDSSWYDGEARNDFWSISGNSIYRHHVEPQVKTVRTERRIITYSTEIYRLYQKHSYIL